MLRMAFGVTQMMVQRLETAMVLQRFAGIGAKTVEIGLLRVLALAEVVEQLAQQALTRLRHGRPVDQVQSLEALQLLAESARLDGLTHRPFAENGARRCVQHVVKQAAGGRVGTVLIDMRTEHGMHRADA